MPPEQREVNGECRSRTMCVVSVLVILLGAVTLPYPLAWLRCVRSRHRIKGREEWGRGGREGGSREGGGSCAASRPAEFFPHFCAITDTAVRGWTHELAPNPWWSGRTSERATAKAMTLLSCCQIQRSLARAGKAGEGSSLLAMSLVPSFLPSFPFIRLLTPFDTF